MHSFSSKHVAEITPTQSVFHIRFLRDPQRRLAKAGCAIRLHLGPSGSYFVTTQGLRVISALRVRFEIIREITPDISPIRIRIPVEAVLHDPPEEDVCAEVAALALSQKHRGKHWHPVYLGRFDESTPGTFTMDTPTGSRRYRWKWAARKVNSCPVKDSFPNIRRRLRDPKTRFVLSLGAGGLRMFAHPSIFKLIDALGDRSCIDELWGCSGGAIMGMWYSLGANPADLEQMGHEIYQNRKDMRINPSVTEILKNLLFDTLLPGSAATFKGYIDMRDLVQEALSRVARSQSPLIPLYAVTYNMNNKRIEILTPHKIDGKVYGGRIKRCSMMNSVLASSAIPILHVPRIINRGKTALTYIDGSFFEELPLSSIYHKWQTDRNRNLTQHKKLFILSVNLFPPIPHFGRFGHLPSKPFQFMRTLSLTTKLLDLARHGHIAQQLRFINHDPDAEAVEVRLPRISRRNCLDPEIIPPVISRSHSTFIEQALDIERALK